MARKERVLTAREEKRKAEFAVTSEMLTARGYERKDLTVSVVQANLGALLMTPFCLIGAFLYLEKYGLAGAWSDLIPGWRFSWDPWRFAWSMS